MRAHCDKDGRIIAWTYLDDNPDFFETEFSNGDYLERPEFSHYDPCDWVIRDGVAYADPQPATEIVDLKRKLEKTDYITAKIVEGAATIEEYSGVIAQRRAWRDRINELEE